MRLSVFLLAAATLHAADPKAAAEFFEMKVRPVLAARCGACHIASNAAGLRLDSRAHAVQGGKSGAALVPGKASDSLLMQAVSHTHARLRMPPGGKLSDAEIGALRVWVDAGAVWPEGAATAIKPASYAVTPEQRAFWSFQPVRRPAVPNNAGRTPIDRFLLDALAAKGLKPVKPADRRTLIRRASLDLTGLPPTPEDVDAFLADRSPDAFATVVDRLLASPHYGERWARYWLDIARYADDKLNSTQDEPQPNAFRYRDWVIDAFNRDLPYDQFLKAQLAGDLMTPAQPAALGFYALSPEFQDDRVDTTTRGFLGLTVACAQCHDHKFDPIPQRDYYSLLAVFNNTQLREYPLAPEVEVKAWRAQKAKVDRAQKELDDFVARQARELADILATKTARFLLAAAKIEPAAGLDPETLKRWQGYVARKNREHPFLRAWDAAPSKAEAEAFQARLLDVNAEEKAVAERNRIKLGLDPSRGDLSQASLESLARDKYVLWREIFEGVLRFREKDLERYLSGEWKERLTALRDELERERKALPRQYAFLHGIEDVKTRRKQHVYLRGMRDNPGEEVPARFLEVLSPPAARRPFTGGSWRLELAEAIASPSNPLTARVMANRVWIGHFGQGIVRTPSNFGQLGERPTHPELLDYLAARLVEQGWSLKKLHREIMLSSAYQLAAAHDAKDFALDPENRLLWRANRRRLDAESLRDSALFVAGALEDKVGGEAAKLGDEKNRRRTVYGFVSRRKLDPMLQLFDFPNPNSTSEQRLTTNVPLQRLYFMNSAEVAREAGALSASLAGSEREKIHAAYRRLFGRLPSEAETRLGLDFLRAGTWPQYAQVLLGSNEFTFIP